MSAPKTSSVAVDPVLEAFDNAPLDQEALRPEEALALDEQLAAAKARVAAGERVYIDGAQITAELAAMGKASG